MLFNTSVSGTCMQEGTDELSETVHNYKRRDIHFQPTVNRRSLEGQLGRSTEGYGVRHTNGKKQFKRVDHKCPQLRYDPPLSSTVYRK